MPSDVAKAFFVGNKYSSIDVAYRARAAGMHRRTKHGRDRGERGTHVNEAMQAQGKMGQKCPSLSLDRIKNTHDNSIPSLTQEK